MRGEIGVLRGEKGFGKLVLIRKMRWERLGAGEGSVWLRRGCNQGRLEIRLRLCGDVWLVLGVQMAQMD